MTDDNDHGLDILSSIIFHIGVFLVYSQNIGPFTANTSLGNIAVTLPATNSLTITSTLTNCASANVTNGVVIIYTTGPHHYVVPVTNGTFSHTLIRCNSSSLPFSVLGIDHVTLQQSVPLSSSGTSGTVNVGTIQACGTSTAQFAQYIIDGNLFSFTSPPSQSARNVSNSSWNCPGSECKYAGTIVCITRPGCEYYFIWPQARWFYRREF